MRQRGPHNINQIAGLLERRYRNFNHHNLNNPLDELLFILCSTKTTEAGYRESYRALRRHFPTNGRLAGASVRQIASAISQGGLAKKKARTIFQTMRRACLEFGEPNLSALRSMNDMECESFLTSLPGVGTKIARCVMLYSLGRRVFPVDVHCWRVAYRLGWIRPTRPNGLASLHDRDRLQKLIPDELRYSLHVNFVSLGRQFCTSSSPKCDMCPLTKYCRRVGVIRSRRRSKSDSTIRTASRKG